MSISSQEGVGTTFYFSLPFAISSKPLQQQAGNQASDSENHALRILLAEDDSISQLVVSTVLGNLGHQVHTAKNGREVLEILRAMPDFDALSYNFV